MNSKYIQSYLLESEIVDLEVDEQATVLEYLLDTSIGNLIEYHIATSGYKVSARDATTYENEDVISAALYFVQYILLKLAEDATVEDIIYKI